MPKMRLAAASNPVLRFWASRTRLIFRTMVGWCFTAPVHEQLWTYFLPNQPDHRHEPDRLVPDELVYIPQSTLRGHYIRRMTEENSSETPIRSPQNVVSPLAVTTRFVQRLNN